jgi:hypothetical protein
VAVVVVVGVTVCRVIETHLPRLLGQFPHIQKVAFYFLCNHGRVQMQEILLRNKFFSPQLSLRHVRWACFHFNFASSTLNSCVCVVLSSVLLKVIVQVMKSETICLPAE